IFNATGRVSQPVDLIIYTRRKTGGPPFDAVYPLQFVLVAIHFSDLDPANTAMFSTALATIQSVKALKKAQPISVKPEVEQDLGSRAERIPKQLLPLGVIVARATADTPSS